MLAQHVIMVRPAAFGFNLQTSASNSFQQNLQLTHLQEKVQQEFEAFVSLLQESKIQVHVFQDEKHPEKPDAVFPNNWFCTFPDKSYALFPMCTPNRRIERRKDVEEFLSACGFRRILVGLEQEENSQQFLEGTGSMVFDHANKICYAAISPRTNAQLVQKLCAEINYKALLFNATDRNGLPVYHTNVVMCMGDGFCVLCTESIHEKELLVQQLKANGKHLIQISRKQMEQFAGNMLLLKNSKQEPVLVMSSTACASLSDEHRKDLSKYARIVQAEIPTIERIGGGSARCMLAEVF